MRAQDIATRDVLVSTDKHGTSYYYVLKVNRVSVDVWTEQGHSTRMGTQLFDRKVAAYPHFWFSPKWGGCEQCRVCSTPRTAPHSDECSGAVVFQPVNGIEQMEG